MPTVAITPDRNTGSAVPSATLNAISIDPSVCWSAAIWSSSCSASD
jgi:hypothetical protein